MTYERLSDRFSAARAQAQAVDVLVDEDMSEGHVRVLDVGSEGELTDEGSEPESEEGVDYNERNQELFAERDEIRAAIAAAESVGAANADQAWELRRMRSRLEDVDMRIVELNYGLVMNYVRKFTSTTSKEDSRDFEGAAVLGLMRAIATYDCTRGSKFSTWAYKPIQRECLKAVRDADFKQYNSGDFEKRPDVLRAVRELRGNDEDAPMPSYTDIAAVAGTSVQAVKRVLNASTIDSLHRPVGDDGQTSLGDLIVDTSKPIDDEVLDAREIADLVNYGLSALETRELYVLGRRFGLDGEPEQRLSAIGKDLGLSREAVRQVEAKALSKLVHPTVLRRLVRHGRK